MENRELINDKIKEYFNIENIQEITLSECNRNFKELYEYAVDRYINVHNYNLDGVISDLLLFKYVNPTFDYNEFNKHAISYKDDKQNQKAQIYQTVFRDKQIKKILKQFENNDFFFFSLSIVLLFIENIAFFNDDYVKRSSLRSSRILIKLLLDPKIGKKLINYGQNINGNQFFTIYFCTSDINPLDQAPDSIDFSFYNELLNITKKYMFYWYLNEMDEEDIHIDLINQPEIYHKIANNYYDYQLFYDELKKRDIHRMDFSHKDLVEWIYQFFKIDDNKTNIEKKEEINTLIDKFGDVKFNDYFLDKITNELIVSQDLTKITADDLKHMVIEMLYYLYDCFVYDNGKQPQEEQKHFITFVFKTYDKYFNECNGYYENILKIEKELFNQTDMLLGYDTFDRDLFKKIHSIIMYCYENTLQTELISFLKTNTAYSNKNYNQFIQLMNKDEFIKKPKAENLSSFATYIINFYFLDSTNSTQYHPLSWFYAYFKVIAKYGQKERAISVSNKYYFNYLTYFKTNKTSHLSEDEKEFLNFLFDKEKGLIKLYTVDNLECFNARNDIEPISLKKEIQLTPEQNAMIIASLKKAYGTDENVGHCSDDELICYYTYMVNEFKRAQRKKFVASFNEQLNNQNTTQSITYKRKIAELKEQNNSLIYQLNQQIDASKELENQKMISIKKIQKQNFKTLKEQEALYKNEIDELKAQLKAKEHKLQDLNDQIIQLEEALIDSSEETHLSNNVQLNDVIGNHNIVIVGGRFELHKYFTEKYPNNIMTISDSNFPKSIITNADIVLCIYKFINHTLFYKIKGLINAETTQFEYCGYTNHELIEKHLALIITKLKKCSPVDEHQNI